MGCRKPADGDELGATGSARRCGTPAILLRSAVTNDAAAEKMCEMFRQQVLPPFARYGPRATAPVRAVLIASQLLGLTLCRYVLKIPRIATSSPEETREGRSADKQATVLAVKRRGLDF